MLPEGWKWKDPADTTKPWRAQCTRGIRVTIEGATQAEVVAAATLLEAGAAALDHRPRPGWVFNDRALGV